jgi:chaperone required for assembly of F1-ATPase
MEKSAKPMRRFWSDVSVESAGDGFIIRLDGRVVMTPLKADLVLPGAALAKTVADEWAGVGEKIDPAAMPMTGSANAAIDRVGAERATFVDAIAGYGETDCFCYRAQDQEALFDRQIVVWDPWLDWAAARYGVRFIKVTGIMHQPQPPETVAKLTAQIATLSDFQLAAMAKLTHLAGSLVAVLALLEQSGQPQVLWNALCLDEDWQAEQWGADDFAIKHRRDREREFLDAARFLAMVT